MSNLEVENQEDNLYTEFPDVFKKISWAFTKTLMPECNLLIFICCYFIIISWYIQIATVNLSLSLVENRKSALFASVDFASKTIGFLKLKSGIKILGFVWFCGFLKLRQEDYCPASC